MLATIVIDLDPNLVRIGPILVTWHGLFSLLGILAAFWLNRWLSGLLFEIRPFDLATFSAVSLLLLTVALIACWIPARRAARIDPIQALREQ